MKKTLVLLAGYPGTGKSYLCSMILKMENRFFILSPDEIKEKFLDIAKTLYEQKEAEFGSEQIREIERVVLLRVVDSKWMDHIDNMDHLKQGMGLRAYKQQDPAQAYQFEGSNMFEEMIYNIKLDTVKYLFHVKIERAPENSDYPEMGVTMTTCVTHVVFYCKKT